MSADRYSQCPKCKAKRIAAATKAGDAAREAYGKVPVEDYHAGMAEADRLTRLIEQNSNDYTFREDWDISGADQGEVTIVYSGSCKRCGAAVKIETSREF